MTSETLLSSLSAYSAIVGIPLVVTALFLTERGWNTLASSSRSVRTTIRPLEGACEKRNWADLSDGPLHMCTRTWSPDCHAGSHVQGARCWETSITRVLNNWNPASTAALADKPTSLPLSREFVHVDYKVVLAFLLAASTNGVSKHANDPPRPRNIAIGSATIDIQEVKSDLHVLHLEGSLETKLTKDYVERLLQGHPPLRDDPQTVSMFKAGDESRGGWIAALGLTLQCDEDKVFLPIYLDCVQYKDRRGHVFWRSMDRVRRILTDIWAPAFATDSTASRDIAKAISALEYIYEHETQSGVEYLFDILMPSRDLLVDEETKIIKHFNGPPLISEDMKENFRREWGPLLHYVLVAAVGGSICCIAYFKNPGREVENRLPLDVLKTSNLYLRGCS